MKYFLDTEFLEGTQKRWFGKTPNTIDLISIGIVSEDGREYYSISKDFNLKEAWNRFQIKKEVRFSYPEGASQFSEEVEVKEYWIRENVLRPIFEEFLDKEHAYIEKATRMGVAVSGEVKDKFTYGRFKMLLNKYGTSNSTIAEESKNFIYSCEGEKYLQNCPNIKTNPPKDFISYSPIEFYAYYADYDWVVFCWIFGKMIDLPKGFPMYCKDLKQILDDKQENLMDDKMRIYLKDYENRNVWIDNLKSHPNYPHQDESKSHNALEDARWDLELYNFLNKL